MEESCPINKWDRLKQYAQQTWKRTNLMANYKDEDAKELLQDYGISMDVFLDKLGMTLDQYKKVEKKVISNINKTAHETNLEDWRVWGMMRIWENIVDNVGFPRSLEHPVIKTVSNMWKVEPNATYRMAMNHINDNQEPGFFERIGINLDKFLKDTEEYRWDLGL